MSFRKVIVWFTLTCFVTTQTANAAGPHDEGVAAGQAANPVARGSVNATSATTVVPDYTTAPSERTYYGQPNLGAQGNARLSACLLTPDDPVCQAQRGAISSANTPRPAVSPYDPAVAGASDIGRNPSNVLGSLAAYYAGCTVTETTAPPGVSTKLCNRYTGIGNYTTRRDLNVQVELVPNCTQGDWFVHGQVNRNGSDYMVAEAQCRLQPDGTQRFRFYAAGGHGACIDWQTVDLPGTPSTSAVGVADLSPHWSGSCWSPFKVVAMPGSGCSAGTCNYAFQFGTPTYSCPAGTVPGNTLSGLWGGDVPTFGPAEQCFAVSEPDPELGCIPGATPVYDDIGMHCALPAGDATMTGAAGWSLPLTYAQPGMNQIETDTWDDKSAALQSGGRCTVVTDDVCVDGPGTKIIDGRPVTRTCWAYERTLSCTSGAPLDECAPLVAAGCSASGSTCKQSNAITGMCEVYQDTYSCAAAAQPMSTASNCPANVFCLGSSCFDIGAPNDADFGRSMSMLEAAREAGVYLDTNLMQVFKGEDNRCRNRLLKNCCYANSAGAGMTNQSLFGTGSRLVYDVLMNAENQQFLYQGMSALLMSGGFSGTFTSYGVTVAVNGAALPAGSVAVYAGDSVVIAFDPWTLVIAIIIYIILSMMSCNEDEGKLAMKQGAGLCHTNGTWCSGCFMVLGVCVSCVEQTTSKCCFNSMLARIVNEQGRAQVGKGWGDPKSPDCSGFTVAQLQTLNFAAMDLSEFYASLVPTLPNVAALQGTSGSRVPTCYYGQGKCQ
jgi:conjugal transfer mating pair stabilization protein TraN